MTNMSDLYDTDVFQWADHQAVLLRRRAAGELVNEAELDWPNIAEEIESLGKIQSRELSSRIATIILHLMKLQASPADAPRGGWRDTILEQRDEIERLLADAPSLRARIPDTIASEMDRAKRRSRAALAGYGADSDEGGHLFQSHRGHHSNLMAATIPISWRPGWHRLAGRFWSCHRGAVWVKRQGTACVNAAENFFRRHLSVAI